MGARFSPPFRIIGPLVLVAHTSVLAAGCKADIPALTDASGQVGEECSPYADLLVAYTPADGGDSASGGFALGAPDEQSTRLAPNDVLTVGFVGLGGIEDSVDIADDIAIVGSAADGTEVTVHLSIDGTVWEVAGSLLSQSGEADLGIDIAETASLSFVVYVQLVGVSGLMQIDAIESLGTDCS